MDRGQRVGGAPPGKPFNSADHVPQRLVEAEIDRDKHQADQRRLSYVFVTSLDPHDPLLALRRREVAGERRAAREIEKAKPKGWKSCKGQEGVTLSRPLSKSPPFWPVFLAERSPLWGAQAM